MTPRVAGLAVMLLGVGSALAAPPAGRQQAADPTPDAQMLLDLDLLKGTDLTGERELYTRMPILERMRILESLPASETGPRPTLVPNEVKER